MSNAMRTGKRGLAGVAAGALAAGVLAFAGTGVANAAGTVSAAVSPVRVTFTSSTLDTVPYATVDWSATAASGEIGAKAQVIITSAPSGTAKLFITGTASDNTDDSYVQLGSLDETTIQLAAGPADELYIKANEAGSYAALIGDGTDTATFSFTSTGKPTQMVLAPATQTIPVGGIAPLSVTLKDAAGGVTQASTVDSIAVTTSAGTLSLPSTFTATDADDSLATGEAKFTLTGSGSAGTRTVTATPAGTLGATGVTTQTASVVESGTVLATPVAGMTVTTPSNAYNGGTFPTLVAQVPAATTSMTVTVDDDTPGATAGRTIRLRVVNTTGTLNGSTDDTQYFNVTTDANKSAALALTLGAGAQVAGEKIVVTQVTSANVPVQSAATDVDLTVTQTTPAVEAADVVPSPYGNIVAQVGATTSVTVSVDDSFGTPKAGYIVTAYRGSGGTGTVLQTATTDASGNATVDVSPLTTTGDGDSETYSFKATSPTGTPTTASKELVVNYTTSGAVTSLNVTSVSGTTSTVFGSASPAITIAPAIAVPASGYVATSAGTGSFNLSTSAVVGAVNSTLASFGPIQTSPANFTTVTVPEGVKVASSAPTSSTSTLWSGGEQSAQIAYNGTAYVWATKTGVHDITFTSGDVTVTGKLVVVTDAAYAYNLSLTPAEITIGAGQFGTVTAKVTDVFGNPVETAATAGDGEAAATATGAVLLGGFASTSRFITDKNGEATLTVIADSAPGTGTVTITPYDTTTAAWVTGYEAPPGAPAPVTSAATLVTVTSSPTAQTISITGERGTVRGKPGIIVDGITTGFDEGAIVRPWVKFPGQTSYSLGVKEIAVDADGEFMWQRRTGKKIYIIIKSEDESVRSNRIIIPAK